MKTERVRVACPRCGHVQLEPPAAISSACKKCGQYLQLEELRRQARRPKTASAGAAPAQSQPDQRRITCFQCGTELAVSAAAQSTMCKRCSAHVDLRDYLITSAVSKNFRTKGRFVIEPGGYVFNTETLAANAVIKGRFLGKLAADSLEIHHGAELRGTFVARKLIVAAGGAFRWPEPVPVTDAEIAGEFTGTLRATGTVVLRSTGLLFGDIEAQSLVVENGAVVVGSLKIGAQGKAVQPGPE
jgi:cytoskeletal protein CcmA (bactofilin family)/ribosomal protein S27E